jgi:hypothetical protein
MVVRIGEDMEAYDIATQSWSDRNVIWRWAPHATKCFAIGKGGLILAPPEHEIGVRCPLNFGFAEQENGSPGC